MALKKDKILRLILGDQLNAGHSWYARVDASVTYVLMEVRSETDYARHHIQKVMAFFAAMRHFAELLSSKGHNVIYIKLNDSDNLHRFDKNCSALIEERQFNRFEYQQPDEYRVDLHLKQFTASLNIPFQMYDTEHFYTTRNELREFFAGKKTFLMESFYRYMRKKHKVLVDEELQPLFGKWNFDEDNRKKLPKKHKPVAPFLFSSNLSDIEKDVLSSGIQTIGAVDSTRFIWPVNREQSLQLLDFFIAHCLRWFGTYQDAMAPGEWSLYHSRLSFSMNVKMLSPAEVVNKVIEAFQHGGHDIEYHQVEGFVRQIIGWREYMRGMYWLHMPDYVSLNYFENTRMLPDWYWTGDTKMNCLKQSIRQSLDFAYAHHIQRLMVAGNFALLSGTHPDEVDLWFLGIYIDAIEWVEITNTKGMSQYADGGLVGTKPYVSSAAYIHKMSSYCDDCFYHHDQKTGPGSCPFNSLYWNFYHTHEAKLASNPRIGMMYKVWEKMNPDARASILRQAKYYLDHINEL